MRWAVLLSLAACSWERGYAMPDAIAQVEVDAALGVPDAPRPPDFHLHVEAWIDGRSNLIISGTSVHWHHFQFAAPGREVGANLPTKLDDFDWYPTWPDLPDAENRECNCDSSTYSELHRAIPGVPSTPILTMIQARKPQSILQAPSDANDYTLIAEITDVGFTGSSWVIVDIDVVVN